MKKIIVLVTMILAVAACDTNSIDEKRFVRTYKDILLTRENIKDLDSANKMVIQVMKKHGYDPITFKNDFEELAKNKERFTKVIDSVRQSVLLNKQP